MTFKLGKLPARPGAISMKFGMFFNAPELPTPPSHFGHYDIKIAWGLLGNDTYSNCVWAGAAHETMVFCNEAGQLVDFEDSCVLSDYAAATGFNPANPATDQGKDMQAAASYRRTNGVVDSSGRRHKVDSYVALEAGDVDQLMLATYLTGAVGVGLRMPGSAEKQFGAAVPWSATTDTSMVGGHYVPVLGKNKSGNILCVTWGRLHAMTPEFYQTYCDEAVCYISLEALNNKGLTPEGFDAVQLQRDLAALTA